ncbi:MAG: TetR/AcrR family transcriptional regulator [Proteobacteria bacterium]|nr:TetR/AcrR family transcriptional regulator [Pseudomonadota bacterium]
MATSLSDGAVLPQTPSVHIVDSESRRIKKLIIEAASELYEKKGLHETSVGEIAEKAGISVPVTYHYVRRKSDIMLLIMEDFTHQIKDHIPPKIESLPGPREKLVAAIEIFYGLVHQNMGKVVLVYRKSRTLDRVGRSKIMADEAEHIQIFEGIIEEGIQAGVFKRVDVNLIAYNILMAGHAWALKHWHFRKRFDLEHYVRRQTDFILSAISA